MNMQTEPTHKAAGRLLELGVSSDEADKALLLVGADGADPSLVEERVEYLAQLCQACGSLQNAKLAYSLAVRSGMVLGRETCRLLAESVRCSECVPAGVRLWKTALKAEVVDPLFLATAASLGEDGLEQIRVLNLLNLHPERLPLAAELARRLKAHGWHCDGSWGAFNDPDRGLVWWDNAVPEKRQSFGMVLGTRPIDLKNRLGARFLFDVRHEIVGSTDRCHLELSTDGRRWEKLVKFEGVSDWKTVEVDLSRTGSKSLLLRFHVVSGGNREGRGMELSNPRLESVQATRQQKLSFGQLSEGWEHDGPQDGASTSLVGTESESMVCSLPFSLRGMVAPTLTMEAKVQASSVYAEATVEVVSGQGEVLLKESIHPSSDWQRLSLLLPSTPQEGLSVRFWSRFAKRRERDGLWIRDARLQAGVEESRELLFFDGGYGDGSKEQKALLTLLETGSLEDLERLVRLRQGLPDLQSAMALSSLLTCESQIPALLLLFSRLKDGAEAAFRLLEELAVDEDLLLQASVLLLSGLDSYPSTRDHLGDGLLTPGEFEDNCRLYLRLRRTWSEEEARRGLSLLLTPVGAEEPLQRRDSFLSVLEENPEPEAFFQAWDHLWAL